MKNRKSIFEFESYKDVMVVYLAGPENRGELTRAAVALQCQRSYLSRVLSESLHLTPEHAFHLAEFWELSANEREYFAALVETERAATAEYRKHWQRKVARLKQEHDSIDERTNRKALTVTMEQATYFTSWVWTAIHFLTAIPEYQTAEKISERLNLSLPFVKTHLQGLEAQGLIAHSQGKWRYLTGEYHAPADSPLALLNHQNWRGRALLDAQDFEKRNLHFTGVLTMSRRDVSSIKDLLLDFIAEANKIAGPSKPEECVALTCDFFAV